MFDIGWTELFVVAVVAIIVVGPKDLPRMLRTLGQTVTRMRSMAGEFQSQFNEALKEAELDDVKKSVESIQNINPVNKIKNEITDAVNPLKAMAADVEKDIKDSAGDLNAKPQAADAVQSEAPQPTQAPASAAPEPDGDMPAAVDNATNDAGDMVDLPDVGPESVQSATPANDGAAPAREDAKA